ncbi:MAG: class I SAM-dependent methyltransferase, partial [Planctomycetes bacterium]|nr:class I SAM-dependent methyltransferase [Planctomycetota bacterium]
DHVGPWYDQHVGEKGSLHYRKVIIPGVLRLLELRAGDKVLDVACGQGALCRALAQRGVYAAGVDLAPSLIEAARRRQGSPTHERYDLGDARRLRECVFLTPASFDAVLCVLAIQNMTPLSPVWEGCRYMLKAGGRLVVVMTHPCLRVPRKSSWGWDEKNTCQYRRVDAYLTSEKIPIVMHPGSNPDQITWTFHRPLQAYINTLGSAGFGVDRIEEWISHKRPPEGRRWEALDKIRREIPLFMAIRARPAGAAR